MNIGIWWLFLQESKEGKKCWLLSTRNLSSENHTMTSLSLPFKAAMELNKDIITQDELKQNQPSINEQSKCKTISWHGIKIPLCCLHSEQKSMTWGFCTVRWTMWKMFVWNQCM